MANFYATAYSTSSSTWDLTIQATGLIDNISSVVLFNSKTFNIPSGSSTYTIKTTIQPFTESYKTFALIHTVDGDSTTFSIKVNNPNKATSEFYFYNGYSNIWVYKQDSVTYDLGSGIKTYVMPEYPTRTGYTCTGWMDSRNNIYASGSNYIFQSSGSYSFTFYAQWKSNSAEGSPTGSDTASQNTDPVIELENGDLGDQPFDEINISDVDIDIKNFLPEEERFYNQKRIYLQPKVYPIKGMFLGAGASKFLTCNSCATRSITPSVRLEFNNAIDNKNYYFSATLNDKPIKTYKITSKYYICYPESFGVLKISSYSSSSTPTEIFVNISQIASYKISNIGVSSTIIIEPEVSPTKNFSYSLNKFRHIKSDNGDYSITVYSAPDYEDFTALKFTAQQQSHKKYIYASFSSTKGWTSNVGNYTTLDTTILYCDNLIQNNPTLYPRKNITLIEERDNVNKFVNIRLSVEEIYG